MKQIEDMLLAGKSMGLPDSFMQELKQLAEDSLTKEGGVIIPSGTNECYKCKNLCNKAGRLCTHKGIGIFVCNNCESNPFENLKIEFKRKTKKK